jgi:hypothetical protein
MGAAKRKPPDGHTGPFGREPSCIGVSRRTADAHSGTNAEARTRRKIQGPALTVLLTRRATGLLASVQHINPVTVAKLLRALVRLGTTDV